MKCEKHADRDGILTVDLPSMHIKRYMCEECRISFNAQLDGLNTARQSARSGYRNIWETSPDGRSYDTDSAYHNPNAQYERNQRAYHGDRE